MPQSFLPRNFFDLSSFSFNDIFTGADTPWEVLPKINIYIKNKFKIKTTRPNYKNRKDVYVGKGTVIEKDVVIKGPAIIGENCYLESGCLLRENCILGDNVHLGHGAEIKNSIIMNDTAIAHFNYVGDSIIGNNVNFSAGAITANLRLDKKPVSVKAGKRKIATGLRKFGALIGDGAVVGVNSVLNPGTILGKNCIVYPLTSVAGLHKDNEVIK